MPFSPPFSFWNFYVYAVPQIFSALMGFFFRLLRLIILSYLFSSSLVLLPQICYWNCPVKFSFVIVFFWLQDFSLVLFYNLCLYCCSICWDIVLVFFSSLCFRQLRAVFHQGQFLPILFACELAMLPYFFAWFFFFVENWTFLIL